jgi:hypothetical protein
MTLVRLHILYTFHIRDCHIWRPQEYIVVRTVTGVSDWLMVCLHRRIEKYYEISRCGQAISGLRFKPRNEKPIKSCTLLNCDVSQEVCKTRPNMFHFLSTLILPRRFYFPSFVWLQCATLNLIVFIPISEVLPSRHWFSPQNLKSVIY